MRWQNSPCEAAHSPSSLRGCHSAVCGERGSQTLVSSLGRGGTPPISQASAASQALSVTLSLPFYLTSSVTHLSFLFVDEKSEMQPVVIWGFKFRK